MRTALLAALLLNSIARASDAAGRTVTIDLPPGVTVLHAPLEVPLDAAEVRIEGHGEATLCGGLVLESPEWKSPDAALAAQLPAEARDHARVLDLPPDRLAPWKTGLAGPVHLGHAVSVAAAPTEVFLGDRALVPARWPNDGWATIDRVVDKGSVPRESERDLADPTKPRELDRGGTFVPKDLTRLARWSAEGVWMHGYWNEDWSDEQLPIAKIDVGAGTVTLAKPHRYGLAARGKFRVTNALGELDAPGECWIDLAASRIVAWLPEGHERDRVTVSMLTQPMLTLPAGPDAPRVTVSGTTFACTRGAAIVGSGVRGATIDRCVFRNIGTRAVSIDGAGCGIERCTFTDIGGTGAWIAGGDRPTLTPGDDRIEDCVFTRCGRLQRSYNPAIELSGVGQRVLRNEVSELPHIAIIYAGNEHRIEANHLHHVVLETGDAGAVCTGRDWTSHGNVLRGNLVHDVPGSDTRWQNAFYVDDMASGITIESNLIVRCNWGMLIGGGRDDIVRDNAFVACRRAISYDARGVGWMAPRLANPATSTLHQRLAAMPIDQEPWRSRYPSLQAYLTDRPGRPVGGQVVGNALLGTPFGSIEDRSCVEESGTVTLPPLDQAALQATCDRLIREACEGPVRLGNTIVGPVGPAR